MSVSKVNDAMERVVGEIQRDILSQEMRVDQPEKKQAIKQQEVRNSVSKGNNDLTFRMVTDAEVAQTFDQVNVLLRKIREIKRAIRGVNDLCAD